ncbi:MAG: aminoacyl-tRNA hydrolase [Chloroflexi bacterium]|nr:aminoacyl-tRNA hydrolase [Chloroflexota bacterium]
MYLIAGLGNPGRKYAGNRHNVGFQCVQRLAATRDLSFDQKLKGAECARGVIGGRQVILVKPQTFMNESGRSVAPIMSFYRIPLGQVLVIYDDLDLPFGAIRLRPAGGGGGHKGVQSIIEHLGGQREFPRLRIGIGRPPGRMEPAAYVLQDFATEELLILDGILTRAVEAVQVWLADGIDSAMTHYNQSGEGEHIRASESI